jgi:hypothetical protein
MRAALLVPFASSLLLAQPQPPWLAMDYGPFVSATFSASWPKDNVANKGIAIHVGEDGWLVFDTELLRVVACGTGEFPELIGTPYDGGHGPIPRIRGEPFVATPALPGVARAGSFADPRPIPHGPLPREHARYRGLSLRGKQVVLGWSIGGGNVLESHALESKDGVTALARSLEFHDTPATSLLLGGREGLVPKIDGRVAVWRWMPPDPQPVTMARAARSWLELTTPQPSKTDLGNRDNARGIKFQAGPGGEELARLNDGAVAQNEDDTTNCFWSDQQDTRLVADLRGPLDLRRVTVFSWHRDDRAPQRWTLLGSDAVQPPADTAQWTKVAEVDTRPLGRGGRHAVSVADVDGKSLGTFRWLRFDLRRPGPNHGTFLTEIDLVGPEDAPKPAPRPVPMAAAIAVDDGTLGIADEHYVQVDLPSGAGARKVFHWRGPESELDRFRALVRSSAKPDLHALARAKSSPRWPETVTLQGALGEGDGAWVVDTIPVPEDNPYKSWMRCAAFDFFRDGRAAVSTWNGDVWIVSGIDDDLKRVTWKRFATGLFDPLGLKIVDDVLYVHGRDQITVLSDTDHDGEADAYVCFNNDVYVTPSFHEFAFDLQTDKDGNFYFSKGGPVRPGGRGFDKITPHHGAVLRVSTDGQKLDVYATGLRAPNGIGVGPDGQVTSGDNQGTWMPVCRLNWIQPGSFLGCVDLAHRDPKPTTYDPPLCFLPMNVDNSGGGQTWVTSDRWGPFRGELLHLSYGTCTLYRVLRQEVDGVMQGGVAPFPLSFASSLMRGRFSERDGQLYVIGFKGWQTRAARDTAFQRVRYTGKPARMPGGLQVLANGVRLDFTDALDAETAQDPDSYAVEQWNYVWSERYGSPEVSLTNPPEPEKLKGLNEDFHQHDKVAVKSARLSADKKSVFLEIPGIGPVMQMKIGIDVDTADGGTIKTAVHLSIHKLGNGSGAEK